MGRTSENPVNHVISFRVNDEEKTELEQLASNFGVSISTLMRRCIYELDNRGKLRFAAQRDD